MHHNKKRSLSKNKILGERKRKIDPETEDGNILEKNTKLVGKSTAIEKSYMRLTTAPKATDVRPLAVLRKSFSYVKTHYIQNEDFDFANEQLKSKFL